MEKMRANPAEVPIVRTIIGIVVAVIVIVAAAIPVTSQVISDAGLTGTTLTVVSLVPLFLGIAAFVITTYVM